MEVCRGLLPTSSRQLAPNIDAGERNKPLPTELRKQAKKPWHQKDTLNIEQTKREIEDKKQSFT